MTSNRILKVIREFAAGIATLTLFCTPVLSLAQSLTDSLNPIELKSVGVTWTRPNGEECFSVTNVNEDAIRKNAGNGSVNNMFDMVPSMVTTSDAGTGVGYTYMRIRGIDQTRINVTLNGIALNDAESQGSWLVNLPDLGLKTQHLEIQRGVGTSNNGAAAFGATMNFSTLDPAEKAFLEFNSAAGSFYTFKNTVAASTGRIKDRFSASVAYSNTLSKGYIDRASANLNSIFFTSDYKMLSKDKSKSYGTLKFNFLYGKEKTGLAWNGVPGDSLATNRRYNSCGEYYDLNGERHYYENETDNYNQNHFQLFYTGYNKPSAKNRLRYDLGVHLTRGIGYYEEYKDDAVYAYYGLPDIIYGEDTTSYSDMITRKYLDNYLYGFNFNIKQNINKNKTDGEKTKFRQWSWSVGGDIKQYDGKHYGSIIWAQRADSIPANMHWYDGTGNKTQGNLFGTMSFSNEHVYTYLDLQYRLIYYKIAGIDENLNDISQKYLWNFFNPKAGINYSWKDRKSLTHSVYTSFAVAHREPTRSDLTESDADRRPVPERMYDVEAGYRLTGNTFAVNANGYFMYYDNQLVLTGEINSVGAAIMTNVKKSFRTGIEIITAYKPVKWFAWNLNATFSMNKILDYTDYIDDWDSETGEQRTAKLGTSTISFSPAIVAGNDFTFTPVKDFNISFITKFVSKQYLDNSQDENLIIKPYCVSNLHFDYTLRTRAVSEIGFFFHINNIFNHKYTSNAWIYKFYSGDELNYMTGYYPQAGINFIGGIRLRF